MGGQYWSFMIRNVQKNPSVIRTDSRLIAQMASKHFIEEMPSISQGLSSNWFFKDRVIIREDAYFVNEQGATFLLGTIGFQLFLLGRITGTAILRKLKAHKVLWLYAIANVIICTIVMLRLGWFSVTEVF